MHTAANGLGIELWSPESVNLPESVARLTSYEADLMVVCDYGEILRPPALEATRLGGVNLHGSLLPKYRGAAPVQWAVLNGDAETGNTVIQMTAGLDAGPCLAQQRVAIDGDETAGELEERLAALGAEAVVAVVEQLATGNIRPLVQDNSAASKAPRLTKQQGDIDWGLAAEAIKNRVRGLSPWPRTFSFWHLEGREPLRVVIDKVCVVTKGDLGDAREGEGNVDSSTLSPGSPLAASGRLVVATGDGLLELLEVQPAGKRKMAAEEFLRGHPGGYFSPLAAE